MSLLVVSLHDVSPVTWGDSEQILRELLELGVHQTSLLVIPNFHRKAPITGNECFRSWLTRQTEAGHEPVLHGYYHFRAPTRNEGLLNRVITRVYTNCEGEFFDLSRPEATRRLKQGRADLQFVGRTISGFIAPAWLLGREAEAAVEGCGFRYTTTINAVKIFGCGQSYGARSLVWSSRSRKRQVASLIWNRGLSRVLRSGEILRIGIHPPDYRIPMIWTQIRALIQQAARERSAITYEQFVNRIEG